MRPPGHRVLAADSFLVDAGHLWYCWKTGAGAAAAWSKLSGMRLSSAVVEGDRSARPGRSPSGTQPSRVQKPISARAVASGC